MKYFLTIFLLTLIFPSQELLSQYYSFGRNKVQYEKFDWKVIHTENLDIYYYGDLDKVASAGAYFAESAYKKLKGEFSHTVNYKIPLIFYNTHLQFQQTNTTPGFIPEGVGGFFEFLKGRVVIPYLGSLEKFRHVIEHELVHVFMTSKLTRLARDRKITEGSFPPLWFVEGLAEYYSTKPDAQATMVMRDAVINGIFAKLSQISRIYGSFLMYKEGQAFLEFIREKYGNRYVIEILDNFYQFDDFDELLSVILNIDFKSLDDEWELFERRKYFPLVSEYDPVSYSSALLTPSGFNFNPAFYFDSTNNQNFVYYMANLDGYSSVYRVKVDTTFKAISKSELVIRGEKKAAIEALHLFEPGLKTSPSGTLAFVSKSGANDVIHLFEIQSDKFIETFSFDSIFSISDLSFDYSGNYLSFRGVDNKGFSDIFILNLNSTSLMRITNDIYDDRHPVFGENGEIIFSSDRTVFPVEGAYNIYSIDIESGETAQLLSSNSNLKYPAVKQGKLYFTSDYSGVDNLYSVEFNVNVNLESIKKETNFLTGVISPEILEDNKLLFTGFEKFSFKIYSAEGLSREDSSGVLYKISGIDLLSNISGRFVPGYSGSEPVSFVQYKPEYTLDYAQSQISTDPLYGTRGGAIFSLSDLLGDDKYFLLLYNTAEVQSDFLESFNLDISRFYQGDRLNYGYGIFNYNGRRYDLRDLNQFYYEKSYGGYFVMRYPFSSFARLEVAASASYSKKEIIANIDERQGFILSNLYSYVFDNTLWGPSGPLDGWRFRASAGFTKDIRFNSESYYSLILDYRRYLRLASTTSLAFRTSIFYNDGKEARRYIAGGSWDLRGWDRFSIRGQKLWLSSVELRIPLIDAMLFKTPIVDIGFSGLRGALFFDAGSAWDNNYSTTYGSVGFGFRFNLFNVIVFRYDIGKKIENNFGSFQPGLFYQFFFGWDF